MDSVKSFNDTNSYFRYNGGVEGGVISLSSQNTKAYFLNSKFMYNYAHKGGVLYLEEKSYARLSAVTIEYNYGYSSAGAIYVATEAYFDMLSSDVLYNQANSSSFLEVLQSSAS